MSKNREYSNRLNYGQEKRTSKSDIAEYRQNINCYDRAYRNAHSTFDRNDRYNKVSALLKEENAKRIKAFRVDRNHPNGPEIHILYDNGVIEIYNQRTQRHISDLIARPEQILSRVKKCTLKPLKGELENVLEMAKKHQEKGYNFW